MGPKCNHICPYKREEEGNLTKGEGEVIMKTEVGMISLQAKECQGDL